jgi:hypothetical protein
MHPNPTALRSLVKEEEVDQHRSVLCSGYDDCLDAALRQSWRSWTCARCKLFELARQLRAAETSQLIPLQPTA